MGDTDKATVQWVATVPDPSLGYFPQIKCIIDDKPKDLEEGDTGTRDDDAITREFKPHIVSSMSQAFLKLYQATGSLSSPGVGAEVTHASGNLGRYLWVVLEIDLGPNNRVQAEAQTATVRVQDANYDASRHPETQNSRVDQVIPLGGGGVIWEKWSDAAGQWIASGAPTANNSYAPEGYRARVLWNTRQKWSVGEQVLHVHNSHYTIGLQAVNDVTSDKDGGPPKLTFERKQTGGAWGEVYASGPSTISADIANELLVRFRGLGRACAGAIRDDVHTASLPIEAVWRWNGADDGAADGAGLRFSLGDNVNYSGEDIIPPKFIDPSPEQGQSDEVDALKVVLDGAGKSTLKVLSSNLISQPKLKVQWEGRANENDEVTSLQAEKTNVDGTKYLADVEEFDFDFDAVLSYRRFPNQYDPDETIDTGWLFDFPHFDTPDRITPAKVYLKFRKDPAVPDIDGNWSFVNDHWLRIKVVGVILHGSNSILEGTPEQLQHYAYVINSNPDNTEPYSDVVKTGEHPNNQGVRDGAASSQVQAGPDISEVDAILIGADELTQVAD